MKQPSLFDIPEIHIDKPIRLIELFCGIGAQAMALRDIGANFERWRLMGFSDQDFDKAAAVNSNTQLYRQAGNSICVNVLAAIFRQLNIKGVPRWNKL